MYLKFKSMTQEGLFSEFVDNIIIDLILDYLLANSVPCTVKRVSSEVNTVLALPQKSRLTLYGRYTLLTGW